MRLPLSAVLLVVVFLANSTPAVDVEILLTTGDRCFGTLLSESADGLSIDRRVWSPNGTLVSRLELSRTRISTVEKVTSLQDLYRAHLQSTPKTYDGQYSLARWSLERGLQTEAFTIAKALYDQDPKDTVTRELVESTGYILDNGAWLSREDFRTKHGLASYGGRLMTPAEANARKRYDQVLEGIHVSDQKVLNLEISVKQDLDHLRDATVALRREERHERDGAAQAEAKRRAALTPDELADEEEARRFDAEHHVKPPVSVEPEALLALKQALAKATVHSQGVESALDAEHANHDALIKEREVLAQNIKDFAAQAGLPPDLPTDPLRKAGQ